MTLLETIKNAVRIRDSVPQTPAQKQRSDDIAGYIQACKDDLSRAGIRDDKIVDSDPRIVQACKLYVMASIDYHGKGAEYWERYQRYLVGAALDSFYLEDQGNV